jgi:hypothetical protein
LTRAEASDPERIAVFRDTKVRPMLKTIQDTDGPMSLDDAGNFDEAGFDMQDFAGGEFICLNDGATSHHVLTPFERAPHITLLFCIRGRGLIEVLNIVHAAEGFAPSPLHLELTKDKLPQTLLAGSKSAWMTQKIKDAWMRKVHTSGNSKLGQRPSVMTCDGQTSNVTKEVADISMKHKTGLVAPPAHTTAMGTQAMDLQGGFIARFKGNARPLIQRQFSHSVRVGKGKGSMKLSVVLRVIQLAASQARDPANNLRDMQRLGFFVNTDYSPPRLDYDPLNRGDIKNSFAAPAAKLAVNVVGIDAIPMSTHEQRVQAAVALAIAEVASLVGARARSTWPTRRKNSRAVWT